MSGHYRNADAEFGWIHRGGLEILNMEWKDGKIIKTVIRSTIGGNLRLRVPDKMKAGNGTGLKNAVIPTKPGQIVTLISD